MNALYAAEHGGCSYIRVLSRALVTHSASSSLAASAGWACRRDSGQMAHEAAHV